MPEHIHLLITEPEAEPLSTALQAVKQSVSRTLALRAPEPFWQARYYDFNVWSEKKRVEKLRYIHRNPMRRAGGKAGRLEVVKFSSLCDGGRGRS
jgi:putative transposase